MTDTNPKDSFSDLGITGERRSRVAICNAERQAAAPWVGISGMCPSCWHSPVDKSLMTRVSTSPTSKSHQMWDSKCRSVQIQEGCILGKCDTALVTCVTAWTCSCNLKGDEDCLSDFKGLFSLQSSLGARRLQKCLKWYRVITKMDFKCVSVGSSRGSVMEKITSNEHFRDMKKQLLWGRKEERKTIN